MITNIHTNGWREWKVMERVETNGERGDKWREGKKCTEKMDKN